MAPHIVEVSAPLSGVYRVGRNDRPVFSSAPWKDAGKGRYDDPMVGSAPPIPYGQYPSSTYFRVVYCSSSLTGSFAECVQKFRTSLTLVASLHHSGVLRDSTIEEVLGDVAIVRDGSLKGIVPDRWMHRRHYAHAEVLTSVRFADICASSTLSVLRSVPHLALLAAELGLPDIDVSAVTGSHRAFTQACARYIHDSHTESGDRFSGLRYVSRLGADVELECWAIFDDRIEGDRIVHGTPVTAETPQLQQAAEILQLGPEIQ